MQYEAACDRICDNITRLLLELRPRTSGAAYSAASATRGIAAAFHHASGTPEDPRWRGAFEHLEDFLDVCDRYPNLRSSAETLELRGFLEENAELAAPRLAHALAS
jgi:hypothetical protein